MEPAQAWGVVREEAETVFLDDRALLVDDPDHGGAANMFEALLSIGAIQVIGDGPESPTDPPGRTVTRSC